VQRSRTTTWPHIDDIWESICCGISFGLLMERFQEKIFSLNNDVRVANGELIPNLFEFSFCTWRCEVEIVQD
jgi:hypothetical protein